MDPLCVDMTALEITNVTTAFSTSVTRTWVMANELRLQVLGPAYPGYYYVAFKYGAGICVGVMPRGSVGG